jgi:hypothetical protein
MKAEAKSPTSEVSWREAEGANNITIQRKILVRSGKWRTVPPEAEAAAEEDET